MHHLGRPFPTAASGGGIVIVVVVGTRHPRKGILKGGKKGREKVTGKQKGSMKEVKNLTVTGIERNDQKISNFLCAEVTCVREREFKRGVEGGWPAGQTSSARVVAC